jgi:hypothetical protein
VYAAWGKVVVMVVVVVVVLLLLLLLLLQTLKTHLVHEDLFIRQALSS